MSEAVIYTKQVMVSLKQCNYKEQTLQEGVQATHV